ncbi:hypothetical protein ETD86_37400 [Nonomuraea turkmeniaca]|uniref:Uncharacterized protein n=1 Tax=Nonomuraea turkmeniaca TaxID=103838 RepID=A0A5S4FP99_9ACTN|nr:hypothetical protein [Nonomuraea turkmeniaca]TMR10995.1 hypothetical protein ETD86_37400 [Nonomuraea turkmeniaca]
MTRAPAAGGAPRPVRPTKGRPLSQHHVTLNGVTYRPGVYPPFAKIVCRAAGVFREPAASEARAAKVAYFARLYNVPSRTAFQIARSITLRKYTYARLEAERIERERIAACRAWGCCPV